MKAYYILDELLIAGELQESSKKSVARLISAQVDFFLVLMPFGKFHTFAERIILLVFRIHWWRWQKSSAVQ